MNNFITKYGKILETIKPIAQKNCYQKQIRVPRLSDIELLALEFTAESMGIDSERQLFRVLPDSIREKIGRSVYNRRRRKLFGFKEFIRQKLSDLLIADDDFFIVDSMPLEVCKLSRSARSVICRETFESAPDKGYCASQKMHYYGYKLHAVCNSTGVFSSIELTPASVHDIHFLKNIKYDFSNCTVIGDKGYLSADYQMDLFETSHIRLEVPYRLNQKNYRPYPYILRKARKRIETLFSQLCDQFMIRRNYAKSFDGFKTRILSKITTITVIQMINKLLNRNINNLKTLVL